MIPFNGSVYAKCTCKRNIEYTARFLSRYLKNGYEINIIEQAAHEVHA
jgi:hypothetical protein